jgi:hypothetical protein
MRDFRDAKAMAQTLREALNARSVSLTHSESLELIAKILGFHDWNVLAARIQSQAPAVTPVISTPEAASATTLQQDNFDHPGKPVRQEITLDAAILDRYVGFYQLNDNAIFTVTRDGTQLATRLTGQGTVPIYPESETEFFCKIVDAQISFITDAKQSATSLILHQGGRNIPMQRIDAPVAQQIAQKTAEKVKDQSATPGTEEALHRLINGLVSGKPNYDEMSPGLAEATRHQLTNLHGGLAEKGAIQSVKFLGVSATGEDVYSVRHENGASHWRIALGSDGKIATAWVTPGP